MEMSQIRYVLAASKTLNFTKAASDCNVSQPALTKAIKNLEEELGSPLFYREGKRVLVTDFGKSMLPHLQQIVSETEVAQSLAENFRLLNKVPVRLGVLSTIGHLRLARFLSRFHRDFSGIEIAVSEGPLSELRKKLDDGELDLAVLNTLDGVADDLNVQKLYSEKYVVILPPDHHLATRDSLKLSDLSGEDYVDRLSCEMREMVMGVCESMSVELYARFRSEREDWVQAMVSGGIGFAFMPEFSVSLPDIIQRPLVEPAVARDVALVSMPGRPYSPAVAALVRSAQTFPWPG